MEKIKITDTTLRDGSHTVRHQFKIEEIEKIAGGLDAAGIDIIEVGHGDGLAGSTCNYGFAKHTDIEMIQAAAGAVKNAMIACLLLPGIGTVSDLKQAKKSGAKVVRVATHVTEADISSEHIREAKDMGFFVVGFLMMAHRADANRIVEEAQKMASYGADVVYATDSSGAMLPNEVTEKITALKNNISIPVGFHSHNNLGLSIGNSLAAMEAGATYIDGSLGGLGAGAGNTVTEMLVAVMNRMKYAHNADLFKTMDISTKILEPIIKSHMIIGEDTLQDSMMLGYADVYSSFMLHAKRAAKRFNVDYREIILELGKKQAVGGQEDWIIEIAQKISEVKNS
ncbi:MAG: 4-hydroxy-2-oxovalerate aldolase [Eubacteriaceae bacterium]|jgi:4-hydroxy 2-oxovalerate aldolase|nr:4-hydroxy-2-oxovalerate aldolase [Eubacteriaceae bacterium]